MIDPADFAQRQMELTSEFAVYILEHPDVDSQLPEDAYVYFHVDDQPEFNAYSQQLAQRREREEGILAVCVKLKGLAPPQGSRLIDPQIIASPNVA